MADMVSKGRKPGAHGERSPRAILTADKVRKMRDLKAKTRLTYAQIASMFGVSKSCAAHAILGNTWQEQ